MGEERRRDLMASAFPVGSSAAIDFTAGEMTLLRALIAGPPTLNRHPLSREFCRGIGWFKPDSGLKDMMARVAHSLMWLPVLQLRHGRRSGDAAPELSAVEGSDPPFGDASIGEAAGAGRLRLFRWLDDDSPAPAFDHIAARTNRKLALLNKGPKTFGDQLGVPVARPCGCWPGEPLGERPLADIFADGLAKCVCVGEVIAQITDLIEAALYCGGRHRAQVLDLRLQRVGT